MKLAIVIPLPAAWPPRLPLVLLYKIKPLADLSASLSYLLLCSRQQESLLDYCMITLFVS